MARIIAIYGTLSGVIIAVASLLHLQFTAEHGVWGMVVGYLIMLIALSMVFVGVKRYRDSELGGVIRFLPAFGVGLAIAAVSALFYVALWEVYSWSTNYVFMDDYIASTLAGMKQAGKPAAEIAKFETEMRAFAVDYNSRPLLRMGYTFLEIAPVGLLVSLISAAILRNPRRFPATA